MHVDVVLPVGPDATMHLRASVESILAQRGVEFLLHTFLDGPNPDAEAILSDYRDSRLRIVRLPRRGLTATLNSAIRATSAPYWARMDGDDIAEPDRLSAQVALLESNSELAAVSCWLIWIDEEGNSRARQELPCTNAAIRAAMPYYNPLIHAGSVIRRSSLLAVGGYDESFRVAQDRDLWFRLAARYSLGNVPAYLMRVRDGKNSVTRRRRRAQKWAAARAILRATRSGVCGPIGLVTAIRHYAAGLWPRRWASKVRGAHQNPVFPHSGPGHASV
jgi:glycosyltransferase involved in cell wall biosynthesis